MSDRFVEIFRYDLAKDPSARLRLDYDPDFGNAVLADENVFPEQAMNPDTNNVNTLASIQLTTPMVRWLSTNATKLLACMERCDAEAQAEVDALRKQREREETR